MLILLIEDETLFRKGLKFLLSDLADEVSFIEYASCEAALKSEAQLAQADLVLLDYFLPGLQGTAALAAMRNACPSAMVVVMSSDHSRKLVHETIEAGAAGFIPKSATQDILIAALRLALAGGVYLPPEALYNNSNGGEPESNPSANGLETLSARQREVLQLTVQGLSNKVIAQELDIAEPTVKSHLSACFRALQVRNRTEAVYKAAKLGMATRQLP